MKTQQNKLVKKLQLNKRTIVMLNEEGMNNLNGGTKTGEKVDTKDVNCPSVGACDTLTDKNMTCTCEPASKPKRC